MHQKLTEVDAALAGTIISRERRPAIYLAQRKYKLLLRMPRHPRVRRALGVTGYP
jgi:hypothetical protein